ncbi:transcription antitermination factor NusB [Calidifontibacter sp. DB0510]|uniref:Transcription antitermination protein NusB n=1 Tax=Metallococcus carri TaxID=1656884 RepID=A0A967E8A8_9MICO|nr:transcription antitermination factor NusB [Metallococcus carri]NHN55022.1 transcription antitermination factor NusB [Metallococcus carri]NOP37368.1 transcription antitermination factor NusB [Calidifontibacter sp. DB2511S]
MSVSSSASSARAGRSARSKARKRALDLLFEAEQRGVNAVTLLDERVAAPVTQAPLPAYTGDLVRGVVEHWAAINEALTTYSRGWTLERMPAVDRGILRLGTFEIVWADEVPDEVAVAEAVALASELSTDESPAFVNGLLSRIAQVKPTLAS